MQKIKDEMSKNKNNPYIQVVGNFLLQYVEQNPQDAEKISKPDKTIAKSLDAMKKEASKKKVGSCAVLTDQEGFAVVLQYFDITPAAEMPKPAATKPKPKEIDFDLSLDDLL